MSHAFAMHADVPSILVVLAAALAAPIIGEVTRRIGLSIVVIELALGVAIGPQGLGWATVDGGVPVIAKYGMAFLFFLAGLEIDLVAIRGAAVRLALAAWCACFALALAVAYAGRALGMFDAWLVVGTALATTALGVLAPILRDTGLLATPFGRCIMAAGVMGELAPILAISLLLSGQASTGRRSLLVFAFVAIVLAVAWAVVRGVAVPSFLHVLRRTMTQSGQLPVRFAIFLLAGLGVLAEDFGLDLALGALAAGMIVKLATQDAKDHLFHHKLDAVGFGFLIPVFFIASGMKLDVAAVCGRAAGLALTAALFAALFLVRMPLIVLHRRSLSGRDSLAVGLLAATTLSLIVALTQIAVADGTMRPEEAGPLVMAGVLSVLVFPVIALALAHKPVVRAAATFDDRDGL